MKSIYYTLLLTFFLFGSASARQNPDPIPAHESFKIESKKVGETRIINVWTPAEYSTIKDSLPVMYMADGGLQEDFPHIANTFAELIKSKSIPPMILVGIENTQRRKDLTGQTEIKEDKEIAPIVGGSAQFRAFLNDELFAEINRRYRTNSKKGILGESLSGLFVVETFLLKPEMFNYYIAFDPSLWWNNHYLVSTAKEHLAKLPKSEIKLWFAGSSSADISMNTNELAQTLKTENLINLKWTYSDEPKEKHQTIFRATKVKAIKWTLGEQ